MSGNFGPEIDTRVPKHVIALLHQRLPLLEWTVGKRSVIGHYSSQNLVVLRAVRVTAKHVLTYQLELSDRLVLSPEIRKAHTYDSGFIHPLDLKVLLVIVEDVASSFARLYPLAHLASSLVRLDE